MASDYLSGLVNQVLIGLYEGSFYWLLAAGLTLIFGVTRILNFAHASLFVMGAYVAWSIYQYTESFVVSILVASISIGLLGLFLEITLIRRVYNIPSTYQLLLTFGIVLVLNDLQKILWGKSPKYIEIPSYLREHIYIGGVAMSYYSLMIILIALATFLLLEFFINRTLWGLRVRAVWRDTVVAQVLRINPENIYMTIFFIGCLLAGLGGGLIVALHTVGPGLGDYLIIQAFLVVVLAGLGNIAGAYLTALLIGVLSSLFIWLIPEIDVLVLYAIAVIILLIKPSGLFGER